MAAPPPSAPVAERPPQLRMLWPARPRRAGPRVAVPRGYRLRQFREDDRAAYLRLMLRAGFEGWDEARLNGMLLKVLPGGFFVAEEKATGALAATAMATHNPSDLHPFGGELGWVAADPDHRGRRLGRTVCAAVIRRFLDAGCERVYLKTDDWRLPAIRTYLDLGFEPFLYQDDMEGRWRAVREALGRPAGK